VTRIIIVGAPAEAGLRDSLVTAFRRCGCTVDVLDLGPWQPPWLVTAAFRQPILGTKFRHQFRRRVDTVAETHPVELVLVIKGAFIDSRTIDYLRLRFDSPVVCWNPDSPFDKAISNRGAGIRSALAAYDAYITWTHDVAEQLPPMVRVVVIPFAWDPELMPPTPGHGVAAGQIVFIGTGTRERCDWLAGLAHLRPLIFGDQWPAIHGLDIRPPVRGLSFCRIVGEARWNLNLLRPQNARSHNMRTFELVGAGGAQVAPYTDDHQRFLGSDSRTVLFRTSRELEDILRSDPAERPARQPALLEEHTYTDRARQLLDILKLV
jgi:Glycosyl transferases group 1